MVHRWLTERYRLTDAQIQTDVAFVGDAPNDEPMFESLTHTFGVANIRQHWDTMSFDPANVLSKPGGLGFAECARLLLA